jgi:chemotaxis signal transduction protein
MTAPAATAAETRPTVVVVFHVDQAKVALPVANVREMVRELPFTAVPLAKPPVVGIVNLRGHVLAVTDARAHLGFPERPEQGTAVCVLVERNRRLGGFVVDSAVGIRECESQRWQPVPGTIADSIRRRAVAVYQDGSDLLVLLDAGAILGPGSG